MADKANPSTATPEIQGIALPPTTPDHDARILEVAKATGRSPAEVELDALTRGLAKQRAKRPSLDVEPVDSALARAQAVLRLVIAAGENDEAFSQPHEIILDAIDTASRLIDEARAALDAIEPHPTPLDVDLPADTIARLDAYAEQQGVSREQAMNQLVGDRLAEMVGGMA